MHQRILFLLRLDRELMQNEIAEAEAEILNNSLMANTEPTNEKIKKGFEQINGIIKDRINTLESQTETNKAKERAFIEKLHGIEDPELKEMAKAYFIDGQSCEEIGQKYYLERTTVYKKLKRFFDD